MRVCKFTKNSKLPLNALVVVEWADAWGKSHWTHAEELNDDDYGTPIKCRTVGWVRQFTEHGVLLTATVSESNGSPLMQFIPRGMIMKYQIIQE